MKKRIRLILILLGVFAALLLVYFLAIRPAYKNATTTQGGVGAQYLFERVPRADLLSVIVCPESGQKYGVERMATSKKDVTDADVTEYIEKFLKDKGLGEELTAAFAREELNNAGYKANEMTDADVISVYRQLVKAGLEAVQENSTTFYVRQAGLAVEDANQLTLNAQKLAELIYAAGSVYLSEAVASKNPEKEALQQVTAAEYEALLKEYGIDGSVWVDVMDGDGKIRRVLIGDLNTAGTGYFVALEGGDLIGSTNSIALGTFAKGSGASLVECAVVAPMDNKFAYNYARNFAIFQTERIISGSDAAKGVTLAYGDVFGFTYTVTLDGQEATGLKEQLAHLSANGDAYTTGLAPLTAETSALFCGLPLGPCALRYEAVLGEVYGDFAGKTVSVLVTSIDYVQKTEKNLATISHLGMETYVDAPYEKYKFEGPDELLPYMPNTSVVMLALEDVAMLKGTVVDLGFLFREEDEEGNVTEQIFNRALMEKYGLWRNHISLDMPYYEGRDPLTEAPVGYVTQEFYVSEKQPDGSYYVGSVLFNTVIRVEDDSVAFTEYTAYDWIKKDVFSLTRDSSKEIEFVWNYGEGLTGKYRFVATFGERKNGSGEVYKFLRKVEIFRYDEQGNEFLEKTLEDLRTDEEAAKGIAEEKNGVTGYTEMFLRMVYMTYAGEVDMTAEEKEAFLAQNPAALTMTFTLELEKEVEENGKTVTKKEKKTVTVAFTPYTDGRCLVTYDGMTSFYTFNSSLRTTALNFLRVLAGEPVNSQDRY